MVLPSLSSRSEWDLAEKLGIPNVVWGPHPSLATYGTKAGSREIFKQAIEILKSRHGRSAHRIADGVENVTSINGVVDAVDNLILKNHSLRDVVVKINEGTGGLGMVFVDVSQWQRLSHLERVGYMGNLLGSIMIGNKDKRSFTELIAKQGGVVEEFVDFRDATFPSAQGEVFPGQKVVVYSTHEQILIDDKDFVGTEFPANNAYRADLAEFVRIVGELLAKQGAIGRYAVDFAVPRRHSPQGPYHVYDMEINLRMGGTTHTYSAATLLTGATYDEARGMLKLKDGSEVVYSSMDHDVRRNLVGMRATEFYRFFDSAKYKSILYNPETRTGVLFHLIPAVEFSGNVGYTILGGNKQQVREIKEVLRERLNQLEREYMLGIPGRYEVRVHDADARDDRSVGARVTTMRKARIFDELLHGKYAHIQFNRDSGGVIFHPRGYTVVSSMGQTLAAGDFEKTVQAQVDALMADFRAQVLLETIQH